MVESLANGDMAVDELAVLTSLKSNLLSHHLDVLESHGLVHRRTSEGDRRRRYVTLDVENLPLALHSSSLPKGNVVFVCTHNSARSQFAAALWAQLTGQPSLSAGSEPADRTDPRAVRVASEFGLDISSTEPGGYDRLPDDPAVIVCVCDRAWEGDVPAARSRLHWSIPDPVPLANLSAFRRSFNDLSRRIEHLAARRDPR